MAKRTRRNAKKKKGNGSDDQIRRKRDRGARSLYQRGKRFRGVNVLPGVGWGGGGRSPSGGEVAEFRNARSWRRRLLLMRRSPPAGPWISGFVAGITDICQVNVGSSLCFFGGRWRRRRWWRWWWTSCTTRTVAHSCLPQSLPAQLGEHAASPMAVALADHLPVPLTSISSPLPPSSIRFEPGPASNHTSIPLLSSGFLTNPGRVPPTSSSSLHAGNT